MSIEDFLRDPTDCKLQISDATYIVKRKLKESGDPPGVASYLTENDSDPSDCRVLKLPTWSGSKPISQDERTRLKERVASNRDQAIELAEITSSGREKPSVPTIFPERISCLGKDGSEIDEADAYVIVREYVRGVILSHWMNAYEATRPRPAKHFAGIREVDDWFHLARMLVGALKPIHNERLVHGDLRPRNIILEHLTLDGLDPSKRDELSRLDPKKIDLKNAAVRLLDTEEDGPESFPAAGLKVTGTFRRTYDSPQRVFEKKIEDGPFVARKNSAQWFAPTDIFSLGVILFILACGKDARLGPFLTETLVEESDREDSTCPTWYKIGSYQATKTNRQLKSALLQEWVNSHPKRLGIGKTNITEQQWAEGKRNIICMSEVILACLRSHTDAPVADLKAIEEIIDEFNPSRHAQNVASAVKEDPAGHGDLYLRDALNNFLATHTGSLPDLVLALLRQRGNRLVAPLDGLNDRNPRWFLRITGRGGMVDNMVNLLGQLRPGDVCNALLTPNFFFKENMGLFGRVSSALQLAAMNGVEIKWILLVHAEQVKNRDVAEVLELQKSAAQFLNGLDRTTVKSYGLYYVFVDKDEYAKVFHERQTGIRVTMGQSKKDILVAPDYHGESGRMSALRIWPVPDKKHWEQMGAAFEQFERSMLPVDRFQR